MRGRLIKTPKGDDVRPTQDMVRQAVFSSLAERIPGASFLDLFAGTGAVGLEAWSRGAARIDWVEGGAKAFPVLQSNLETLCGGASGNTGDQEWRATRSDVFRFIEGLRGAQRYDLIFADPPYDRPGTANWAGRLLNILAAGGILADDGQIHTPIAHGISQTAAAMRLGLQRGTTEMLADGWQRGSHQPLQHARTRADDEGLCLPDLLFAEVFEILKLLADQYRQSLACGGKGQRLALPPRQLSAEELLQFADLAADLALPVRVPRCCLRDAFGIRHLHEATQPVE